MCCRRHTHICYVSAVTASLAPFWKPLFNQTSKGVLAYAVGPLADQLCTWGNLNSSSAIHYWLKLRSFCVPAPRWTPAVSDRSEGHTRIAALMHALCTASEARPHDRKSLISSAFGPGDHDASMVSEVITCLAGIGLLTARRTGGQGNRTDMYIRSVKAYL